MQSVIRFCVYLVSQMRWCTAPVHCLVIVRCKPRKKVCWMTRILSETVWNDESARMLSGFTNRKGACALTCGFSIRLCFPAPSHYLASMIILYDDDCSTSPSHDKDNFIQSLDKNCPKPEVRVMSNHRHQDRHCPHQHQQHPASES